MAISDVVLFLLLGAILGTAGQGLRVIVGIKKELDEVYAKRARGEVVQPWFNGKELGISLFIGAIAGLLAAVIQYQPPINIDRQLMLSLIAAGYAGSDFIMGLIKKWLP